MLKTLFAWVTKERAQVGLYLANLRHEAHADYHATVQAAMDKLKAVEAAVQKSAMAELDYVEEVLEHAKDRLAQIVEGDIQILSDDAHKAAAALLAHLDATPSVRGPAPATTAEPALDVKSV